jgi:hypothetical protein
MKKKNRWNTNNQSSYIYILIYIDFELKFMYIFY